MTRPSTHAAAAIDVADPGECAKRSGIEIEHVSADRATGSMPVAGNTQTFGLLHGGASCVLAETLASLAACRHFAPDGVGVGVDINATHHAAARGGRVTGVARALRLGRSIASYEVSILDDDSRLVCTARMTAARQPRPAGEAAGTSPSTEGEHTGGRR